MPRAVSCAAWGDVRELQPTHVTSQAVRKRAAHISPSGAPPAHAESGFGHGIGRVADQFLA